MAFAREVYEVSDAAGQSQFDIPFPYIKPSHITVSINGVATDFFSFLNPSRIELLNPAAEGDIVSIVRQTSPTERLVDYQTGSVLSEEILDQDSLQGFYLAQEANDIKEIAMARDAANRWVADGSRIISLADPIDDQDAATKAWVIDRTAQDLADVKAFRDEALGYKNNALASQNAAAGSATLASQNNQAAEDWADDAKGYRDTAQAYRNEAQGLLNAAKLPTTLTNHAGEFLQVKADSSGYELVSSVAAPSFFGFKMSADGQEIVLTYGRDADFDVNDYDTWTIAENVTFSISNNNLAMVL
jgi:hypothetical protein